MLKGFQGITIEWVICILALFFVLLRFYVRLRMLTTSDWLIVVTWLLHLTGVSFHTSLLAQGFAKDGISTNAIYKLFSEIAPVKLEAALKILYAGAPIQYLALWGVKIVILLFFYELVPRSSKLLRLALHSVSVLVACSLVVSVFLNLFYCYPVDQNWDVVGKTLFCFSYNERVPFYLTMGFDVATGVLLLIIPFFLLRNTQLSRKKLYSLISVYIIGSFSILCAIAHAACVGAGTAPLAMPRMFSALELGSGIIVASCLSFKQLLFGSNVDETVTRRRELLSRFHSRLNTVALSVLAPSQPKEGDTNATASKGSALGSKFEWDTDVESGRHIKVGPVKPEAAKTRNGSTIGRQYNPADRHSRMAGGLAGVPSSTEPLLQTGQGSDQELNIYRNLRHAYDVHLHIDK